MLDTASLFKSSGVYKILCGEKQNQSLSHAYLLVSPDDYLSEYVKQFAYLITATGDEQKDSRLLNLIQTGYHPDIITYPVKADSVTSEEAVEIVRESYVKPLELDKKVFIILNADKMNAQAQNKLLKTLEEPPKNVHFILCAKTEYPLLQTVKSRVKKFEITSFSNQALLKALAGENYSEVDVKRAIALSDKTLSSVIEILNDENVLEYDQLAVQTLTQMLKSTEVLTYSNKICALNDVERFLSVLESKLKDLLYIHSGKVDLVADSQSVAELEGAKGFKTGSILHAIECVNEGYKRLKFNANTTAVVEWLLFQILEGKYKWQKL